MRSVERVVVNDAVDRLQRRLDVDGNGSDIVEVALHRLRGAEAVKGADDEVGIAQPAEAIVPVALRAGRLGNGSGMRRDDGAGLLEVAELQGDGGADDRLLPVERDTKAAHPSAPIAMRPLQEFAGDIVDRGFQRLVRSENERHRMGQGKRRLVGDVGKRRVGGQAQDVGAAAVAYVVGADRHAVGRPAVIECRPQADGHPRQATDGLDATDNLGRMEGALEAQEARREIGDAHRVAVRIFKHRLYDGSVAHVLRTGFRLSVQDDVAKALLFVAGEQTREHRIGIEARKAPPDNAALRVDERSDAPIADGCEVKVSGVGGGLIAA